MMKRMSNCTCLLFWERESNFMIICKTCLKTEKRLCLSCFFVNIKSKPRLPKSLYEIFIFMDTKCNGSVRYKDYCDCQEILFFQTWGTLSMQVVAIYIHHQLTCITQIITFMSWLCSNPSLFAYAEKRITLKAFFVFFVVLLSHNYLVISLFTSVFPTLNSITNCFH